MKLFFVDSTDAWVTGDGFPHFVTHKCHTMKISMGALPQSQVRPMLEKVAAVAVENAPAIARLSDEAFALLKAPIKNGVTHMGTEIESVGMVGRVFATDTAKVAHFPGHSSVEEGLGNIRLLSADGAKLQLTPTQVKMELLDGTLVTHEGKVVTSKLPGGDILRQEVVADDRVVTTLNGKELRSGAFGQKLPDGAELSNYEKHASSVFLGDGTYIGRNSYGFDLYRGVDPKIGWRGGQAEITVELSRRTGHPTLVLHNPAETNMFRSNFLWASADNGVVVRTGQSWTKLGDFLK